MKRPLQWILVVYLAVLAGCSSDNGAAESASKQSGDHVWKAQENAYKKVQNVAPMMDKADQRQRDQMEQQGG